MSECLVNEFTSTLVEKNVDRYSLVRRAQSELCAVGLRHKGAAEREIGVVSTLTSWWYAE
jgi:hypothetical protein